jgi:hypothetical protein
LQDSVLKFRGTLNFKTFGAEFGNFCGDLCGWCFPGAVEVQQFTCGGFFPMERTGGDLLAHFFINAPDDMKEGEGDIEARFKFPAGEGVDVVVMP